MATIAELRQELAAALAAATGLVVTGHVPERINPPMIYCHESDPFVTPAPDAPYGTSLVSFDVDVIEAVSSSNEHMVSEADKHVEQCLTLAAGYGIEIGAYATASHSGQTYMVVPIKITTTNR